jgi:glucose-1-phosphate adenylyltransferase
MPHLRQFRHSHVLILAGDQLYTMDYRKMFRHHVDLKADITLATIPVTADDAPGFGILKTDDEHVITEFHEKPKRDQLDGKESPVSPEMEAKGRIYLASMGIYIFNRALLTRMLDDQPDSHDFGKEILPRALGNLRVLSYPFPGYWSDIGTIRSFFDANLMLARRYPEFNMYDPYFPILTNARMLPPAKIVSSYIQESLIGEASVIVNSQISNAVIGIRSYIANNTTIKNAVIMGSDYYRWHDPALRDPVEGPPHPGIGEESYIEGAIVDRNVSIGRRCIIKNRDSEQEGDGPNFFIRDGIVCIPKNAEIPDDTII